YFNFGSSSMLVKRHFKSGNFNLEFVSPRSITRDGYFKTSVRDEKISTSGDNEQRYFIDGTRYCHIIDPTTGKPVQTGIMSATVIGGTAASADALTTAIMAMGKDKAISFIEENLTDRKVVFTVE
ncbi:MAG: FAD:protein FMN transferase, partial [Clostridia bacterium]|nr:FAD:protein FMN transferase [Clostridia bacterium]